jgi:hypothetical protein
MQIEKLLQETVNFFFLPVKPEFNSFTASYHGRKRLF